MNKPKDGTAKMRFKSITERRTMNVVFAIPVSDDEIEKAEVLENQIISRLVNFSNRYNSYDKAIDDCQGYLKALINHYPEEVDFIRKVADDAGAKFLKIVKEARGRAFRTTIERGDMILGVKHIS